MMARSSGVSLIIPEVNLSVDIFKGLKKPGPESTFNEMDPPVSP